MKNIISLLAVLVVVISCKNETKSSEKETEVINTDATKKLAYQSFGAKITDDDALTSDRMLSFYKDMKVGDTLNSKMKGKISEVCSKKGCWMKLDMGNNEVVRVTFKDYGFFMPLDAADAEVVINGKAFVKETSVADLKHYAEDAGDSTEEIARITEPEVTYAFEADGVLLNK